jgi:hypothetical protein
VALWGDTVLPTTVITENVLTAQVNNTLLNTAGIVQIRTRAPSNLASNALPFVVEGVTPAITSFSPAGVRAGSPTFTLIINGSNFAPNAKVLWNGTELTPHFVNASRLEVEIDASLLEVGQVIGISVGNPTPTARISSVASFEVRPAANSYIPGVFKQP